MSDPTQRPHDDESGAPAPDWLLSNDRPEDDPHPDLLDPTFENDPSPAPAGTDENLRLQPGGGSDFSDDTSDIIGIDHLADDAAPVSSGAVDTSSAIPHAQAHTGEETFADEFDARPLAADPLEDVDDRERDLDADYDRDLDLDERAEVEPATYPLLADEGEAVSDPDAPRDVLARRDLPAEPTERREYDLSRLNPEPVDPQPPLDRERSVWDEPEDEATTVQRQSLLSPDPVDETVVAAPATTTSWQPVEEKPRTTDDALFEESSVVPDVPSRASARMWSFLLTLLLVPAAWYLLSDAAARLTLADGNAFETGVINPAALLEMAGGLVLVIVILAYLVRSSLGALIWGFVLTAVGATFLAVPTMVKDYLAPAQEWLHNWNAFGGNVAHHIEATGFTGILLISGVVLFALGIVAILARRDGRREAEIRAQIERLAPGTFSGRRKRR